MKPANSDGSSKSLGSAGTYPHPRRTLAASKGPWQLGPRPKSRLASSQSPSSVQFRGHVSLSSLQRCVWVTSEVLVHQSAQLFRGGARALMMLFVSSAARSENI